VLLNRWHVRGDGETRKVLGIAIDDDMCVGVNDWGNINDGLIFLQTCSNSRSYQLRVTSDNSWLFVIKAYNVITEYRNKSMIESRFKVGLWNHCFFHKP
jgi:hypothetical protein